MSNLVNRRMGKRQSMRSTSQGAHYLLLVRCATLDDRLEDAFRAWYPTVRPAKGLA